uniref:C2H2-type domain-containing protein n=1 Tax=Timema tahoe TaxID=61484 RepID=A0A7R9FIV2_9NEOP|nr:unnamed protein product [Timema tahoe]
MKASKDILNRQDGEEETCSFTCEHCGKMYKRKTGLKRHLEFECGKQPQFPRMCDIYFEPLESLSSAVCTTIQNERCSDVQNVDKYHCPNCGKKANGNAENQSVMRHLVLEISSLLYKRAGSYDITRKKIIEEALHNNACSSALDICEVVAVECNEFGNESCYETSESSKHNHDEKIQCEIETLCYRNIFPTTENSSEEDNNDSADNYAKGQVAGELDKPACGFTRQKLLIGMSAPAWNKERDGISKFWKEKDQMQFEYPINDSRIGNIHKEYEHLMRERRNMAGTNFIERKFVCPKCKKAYKNKNHLGRHLKLECGVEPQFACQMCFRRFTHKHNMLSHVAFVHNKASSHLSKFLKQTKQLNSLFGTEYDVNDSRLFYGHEEPEYLMSNGRNVAGLDVSDRKFLCTNCTKSYKHKHHLLRHLRLECGVEPKLWESSSEQWVQGNWQVGHMSQFLKANKHSDVFFETEYIVEDSRLVSNHEEQDYFMQGRRTIRAANVSERKFVCPNCTKSYKYKHDLLRHLRLECGVEPNSPMAYLMLTDSSQLTSDSQHFDLSKFLRGTKHSFGLFGTEYGADNSQSLFTQTEQELLMRRRRNAVELNDLAQNRSSRELAGPFTHWPAGPVKSQNIDEWKFEFIFWPITVRVDHDSLYVANMKYLLQEPHRNLLMMMSRDDPVELATYRIMTGCELATLPTLS